jgi:hypothetical protein
VTERSITGLVPIATGVSGSKFGSVFHVPL